MLHWQTMQNFSVFQSASTTSHRLLLLVGLSSERPLNITSQPWLFIKHSNQHFGIIPLLVKTLVWLSKLNSFWIAASQNKVIWQWQSKHSLISSHDFAYYILQRWLHINLYLHNDHRPWQNKWYEIGFSGIFETHRILIILNLNSSLLSCLIAKVSNFVYESMSQCYWVWSLACMGMYGVFSKRSTVQWWVMQPSLIRDITVLHS